MRWLQHLSSSLRLMQQMYGLCIRYKCFRGSSATLSAPERRVSIHPNHPDLHNPFSSICSHTLSQAHVLSCTCHWQFIFMPLLSRFGHKVPEALPCRFSCLGASTQAWVPCAASPEGIDPASPVASTAPACFSGAPSSALLTVKT